METRLLDKKEYYDNIKMLERMSLIFYIIWIVINSIIGFCIIYIPADIIESLSELKKYAGISMAIGFIFALLTYILPYILIKLKVQDMKMKLDIYNKIIEKEG